MVDRLSQVPKTETEGKRGGRGGGLTAVATDEMERKRFHFTGPYPTFIFEPLKKLGQKYGVEIIVTHTEEDIYTYNEYSRKVRNGYSYMQFSTDNPTLDDFWKEVDMGIPLS